MPLVPAVPWAAGDYLAENLAAEPGAEQAAFKKMMEGTPNLPLVAASARATLAP